MNPSYRIVFYVSGHGFGHASRVIEVVHAMLRAHPGARIVVKAAAPLRLLARALQGRCELVELQCDAGMVQIDSLSVDPAASIRQAVEFQTRMPALIATEVAYLRQSGARVAVGDIPPIAVAAARAAGIPSVAIGNFTWDWIYESYRGDAAVQLSSDIRALYRDATVVLRLPMAGGFAGLESTTRDIPFIARRSQRTQDAVRDALGLPPRAAGKPLVLISFGAYGVTGLDTAALSQLKEYTIATTDPPSFAAPPLPPARDRHDETSRRAEPAGSNAIQPATGLLYISEQQLYGNGLRYEDLVRGADVVVTKPGYGIISEAIANGAALLYTSRGRFVEYDVLVKEMPKYLRTKFIDQSDLLSGNWSAALHELLRQPAAPERPPLNGAEIAAKVILEIGNEERNPKIG